MTPTVLYSLRTEIDADGAQHYRITKFVDGDVESSYHVDRSTCECPAGQRPTCRHRQMLPHMLNHNLANSHFFWDHDHMMATDFEGVQASLYETCEPAEPAPAPEGPLLSADPAPAPSPSPRITHPWRRL